MTDDTTGEDTEEKTVAELLAEEPPEPPDDPVEAIYDHAGELLTITGVLEDSVADHHVQRAMERLEQAAECEEQTRALAE